MAWVEPDIIKTFAGTAGTIGLASIIAAWYGRKSAKETNEANLRRLVMEEHEVQRKALQDERDESRAQRDELRAESDAWEKRYRESETENHKLRIEQVEYTKRLYHCGLCGDMCYIKKTDISKETE